MSEENPVDLSEVVFLLSKQVELQSSILLLLSFVAGLMLVLILVQGLRS